MKEVVEILGWINVFLLVFNLSLFISRRIYKNFIKDKKSKIAKYFVVVMNVLKKYHKLSGILLVINGIIHGYIALNKNLQLHTGLILWLSIVLMFSLYLLGRIELFKKNWIKWHRYLGFILIILLLIHLINPWLL
ncbi:hypothetical protein [Marinitoga litoralis]|uniref:hypothetical protein n=1 Tax=Marinitoga litoralis TaxID=570855 RepID=UPI001960D2D3|nr:hypothetical protein [Marinitoga litoralis]MBM7559707.1 hypothetical protein [Marinitoga litoralis]